VRRPVEELVTLAKTKEPMSASPWMFTGSQPAKDPSTGETILQANLTRSLVGLHPGDASPLLQNPRPESVRENTYAANLSEMPPVGGTVRFIFERIMPPIPPGTKRVQAEILGRVTGVGFRNFTQFQANQLGLKGGVRNAAENRVVATIEGPAEKVDKLIETLKVGPRAAKVEKVSVKEVAPEGDYDEFEIQY
jgi:acylphosphatase